MHIAPQAATPATTTGSANATTNHTIAGVSGRKTRLVFLSVAWTGGTPAAAVNATISDGTTTLTIPIPVTGFTQVYFWPFDFLAAATITVSVPAGGVGIQSIVSTGSYNELP